MPSKVDKHVKRMARTNDRIQKLRELANFSPEFRLPCETPRQGTYQVAYVRDDGSLELRQIVLEAGNARNFAIWILEWYAGHEEPPEKEEKT